MKRTAFVFAGLALPAVLHAQVVVNGEFDGGSLAGWTVTNTPNGVGAPGSVTTIDIDGPGPLNPSNAAVFLVGLASFQPNSQGGVEVTQPVNLNGGQTYRFSFDWSAQRLSTTNNGEGGVFSFLVNGAAIATQAAGDVSSLNPKYGALTADFTPPSSASYTIGLRITRPFLSPGDLFQYVDNIEGVVLSTPSCYANCDESSSPPVLTANDFVCFINRYTAGESYANCDGSTGSPSLTANDFTCFLTAFVAGCS